MKKTDVVNLTDEQKNAVHRSISRHVSVERNTQIDVATGEASAQETRTVSVAGKEPPYVKVYYEAMLAFNGVTGIPADFLLLIAEFMTYSGPSEPAIFQSSSLVSEKAQKTLHIQQSMYTKYISKCVNSGLLFPMKKNNGAKRRGFYEVNPWLIAKGEWKNIQSLQATFSFIDGKWTRTITTDAEASPKLPDDQADVAAPDASVNADMPADMPDALPY